MDPDEPGPVAKHVMKLLVERRFGELEAATKGKQLNTDDMRAALDEVGSALVMPPESAWGKLDVTGIRNWPGAFSVVVDLWTARGRSDWSMELTLHTTAGRPVIELDDIHPR